MICMIPIFIVVQSEEARRHLVPMEHLRDNPAAIRAAILAARAARAAFGFAHTAALSEREVRRSLQSDTITALEARWKAATLKDLVERLPRDLKDKVFTYVVGVPMFPLFSLTNGTWIVRDAKWILNEDTVRFECRRYIPHPNLGAYMIQEVGRTLSTYSDWSVERVDNRKHQSTPRVPTEATPLRFEWMILNEGQNLSGWWAEICCKLSLYNCGPMEGPWTSQKLQSLFRGVNRAIDIAVELEERSPFDYGDPYEDLGYWSD